LALEAKQEGFQQIHQTGTTGVLINVPLRDVLSKLLESLGVDYVVAEEELDKPVSVKLSGETLVEALPKILSFWDYALQTDRYGNVRHIYVVKKAAEEFSEEQGELVAYETEVFPNTELSQLQFADPAIPQDSATPEMEGGDTDQEELSSPAISVSSAELAKMLLATDAMSRNPDSASPSMDIIPAPS
jgi:hypothetical protein